MDDCRLRKEHVVSLADDVNCITVCMHAVQYDSTSTRRSTSQEKLLHWIWFILSLFSQFPNLFFLSPAFTWIVFFFPLDTAMQVPTAS